MAKMEPKNVAAREMAQRYATAATTGRIHINDVLMWEWGCSAIGRKKMETPDGMAKMAKMATWSLAYGFAYRRTYRSFGKKT